MQLKYQQTTDSQKWLYIQDSLDTSFIGGTIVQKFNSRVGIIRVHVTRQESTITYTLDYLSPDNTSFYSFSHSKQVQTQS